MYNILCFGDSNTFGTNPSGGRWARTVRWTGLLQDYLGSDYYLIEEGLGGRNTLFDDPLEPGRNGLALLPVSLKSHKPLDLVILSLGTNDCKVHFNANARVIAKGMETLVKTILQFPYGEGYPLPKVLVISPIHIGADIEHSPFVSFDQSSYRKSLALAPLFEQVAQSYGCLFLDASLVASPSTIDQLHMDAQGHENLAKALVPILQQLFGDERQLFLEEELPESESEQEIETLEIPSAEEESITSLQIAPIEPQGKKAHRGLTFRIPGFSKKKGD
ncbi:lysophospholipase L1-like esterase [Sphaerochaeta pleomorpha str. Grapes]|uniref:Lysophospholipase L1-like esterase n=1 Tax=Sphaerochaeta pleomorpha (strain ATCC BAA-1885 / DSM 22778 / Grapes) TaxID=158190 RepID=G8QY65_SPHPG|nr:SGNH/GDSL hydrolase family protein [Sphaerochaeta pleomorpha]AEV29630.1 lysophospholipase L1-like esterase [Sphaerochaeta pleomorpha str. Grapes]